MSELIERDISHEIWREYEFGMELDSVDGFTTRVYRIDRPITLFTRPGGTTHRVVDSDGVTHCVPAPGHHGCVLRWYNGEGENPCRF